MLRIIIMKILFPLFWISDFSILLWRFNKLNSFEMILNIINLGKRLDNRKD